MKKILSNIFLFTFVFTILFINSSTFVHAQLAPDCSTFGVVVSNTAINPDVFNEDEGLTAINISLGSTNIANEDYRISVFDDRTSINPEETSDWVTNDSSTLSFQLTSENALTGDDWGPNSKDTHHVYLYSRSNGSVNRWCHIGDYDVTKSGLFCTEAISISQTRIGIEDGTEVEQTCYHNNSTSCLDAQSPIYFSVNGLIRQEQPPNFATVGYGEFITFEIENQFGEEYLSANSPGDFSWNKTFNEGNFTTWIEKDIGIQYRYQGFNCDGADFTVVNTCPPEQCEITPTANSAQNQGPDTFKLCTQVPIGPLRNQCIACAGGIGGKAGVWTAVGCINRDPQIIIQTFVRIGLGIAGGVALLMFLGAGFIMSTSQGDAKKVGDAKDMMTAAVVGLIFIIFSVTILQFIGFSILKIPGFGG